MIMMTQQQPLTHVRADAGAAYLVVGDLMIATLTSEQTGGALALYQTIVQSQGGPPIHTHAPQEVFYVQEGEFAFFEARDGEVHTTTATAGETIHIPTGIPHAYRNIGTTPGRLLTLFVPSQPMEAFFAELGLPVADITNPPVPAGPPDFAVVAAICAKHGVGLPLPPESR
jgi:quercetin dioxygenase-like cupin family protein